MADLLTLERFDRPWCLWLALGVAVLWWMSRRSLAGLGPIRGRLCLAARAVVTLLLLLALAGTHRIEKNDDLNVLFVIDQSRSVPGEARQNVVEFMRAASQHMRPQDRLSILTFDGQTNIEQLPSRQGPDGAIHVPTPFDEGQRPDRTNIAQALRVAAACALESGNNRIVVLTDGNQNIGDALAEVRMAQANRIAVDVVALRSGQGAEVRFEELRVPPYANLHERIPVRMILHSTHPATGTVLLYQRVGQEEKLIDLGGEGASGGGPVPATSQPALARGWRVSLQAGRNALVVRLPIEAQRSHEFRADFIPDQPGSDTLSQNNVVRAFTNVEGPRSILFLGTHRDRQEDELLIEALEREKIIVRFEPVESVNLETSLLQDYSAIVLSNVAADHFNQAQQQALATYVRDLGGGLIMIGGDDSFGAGGWQGSVVEDIMPVRFDVDAVKQIPRGALAVVMHSCEMPQGNKWGIEVAVAALKVLSSLDYFGVVSLGMGNFAWDVPMQPASNKEAIIQRIRGMQNADMFDFDTPMTMAYRALLNCQDAAQRHMIIISDGDPAAPSNALLNKLVGSRITCSTVSIFPHGGAEIATLQNIARVTKGRYYNLSKAGDEKQLPRIFTKEARVVRRPLVRDEVFTPVVRPHLSDLMAGIEAPLPPLGGYVVTTPRKVPDVEMPLVTRRGDPLLAHWMCGFGRTVAFTSGRWKQWGRNWPEWPSFSKLWAQCVRWCMQQGTAADYEVTTEQEGDTARVIIESREEKPGFADFRQFVGRALRPDGTAVPVSISQTGPGRYEGRFEVGEQGTYLLQIHTPAGPRDKPVTIRTGLTFAYSPEFRESSPNEALLREMVDAAGGRALSLEADPRAVYAHNLPPSISRTPIWQDLLRWAIVAFLLDVGVRRVALDPIRMLAAARAYIAALAGRWGAGRRAEATLADLKGVREKVRAGRTGEGDAGALASGREATGAPPPAGPRPTARFEAAGPPAERSADLDEALSGRQPAGPAAAAPSPSQEEEKAGESTMSRLLKAKKRAQDQEPGEGKS